MQWEQSCHHQPCVPPAPNLRWGHRSCHQPLTDTLLARLEGVPGLGLQNAPMMELPLQVSLPAWAQEQVIFHSRDQ